MNKALKTKRASAGAKPEVKSRNRRGRKKIKLIEEKEEEEVKDVVVEESEDEIETVTRVSENGAENSSENGDEIQSANEDESDEIQTVNEDQDMSENNEEIQSASEDEDMSENDKEIQSTSEDENMSENNEEIGSGIEDEDNEMNSDDGDSEVKSENDDEDGSNSESDIEEEMRKKKPATRKRRRPKYNAEEEARLEHLVFGNPDSVIHNLLNPADTKVEDEVKVEDDSKLEEDDSKLEEDDSKLEEVLETTNNTEKVSDSSDDSDNSDVEIKSEPEDDDDKSKIEIKSKAAWIDEDDMKYSVEAALTEQHRKLPGGRTEKVYTELLENKFNQLVGTPKWASLDPRVKDEDEDSDNEILKHSIHLETSKGKKLRKGTIDIKALTDINKTTHTEGPWVSSLQFHPTSTVALVAGESGILSLFQIDGRENNKLHSVLFEKFHINGAKFLKEGTEVIMGSRYKSFSQAYDLMSGKTYKIPLPKGITNMQKFEVSPDDKWIAVVGRMGQIYLLSAATKELIATFKMNKRCLALAFSPDSRQLISHGDTEEMYIWDLNSRSCLHKAVDDGCIAGSAVTLSPSGQFLATGSKQGVVNIYDTESVLSQRNPAPLKIILNLVTPITSLKFNPTSEILAMASNEKENAFKMVHIPSFTVFSNFPTFQTKMFNPLNIDFSPGSGYLGLCNNKGNAYLYRLKHYGNY